MLDATRPDDAISIAEMRAFVRALPLSPASRQLRELVDTVEARLATYHQAKAAFESAQRAYRDTMGAFSTVLVENWSHDQVLAASEAAAEKSR